MNIFKILSAHDGKIHEPSITSLLAYLLNANEDHGLSSLLLKSFVEECNKAMPDFFKGIDWELCEVSAEAKLELDKESGGKKKTTDFDVLVLFYPNKTAKEPSHVLGIENKIKDSSRREGQLQREWSALEQRFPEAKRFLCFLTPTQESCDDFKNVPSQQKIQFVWKNATNEPSEHRSVLEMLVNILQKEEVGEVDPIPGDSIFLIKSLLAFIRADFKAQAKDSLEEIRERHRYGKPVWQLFADAIEKHGFDEDIDFEELLDSIRNLIRQTSDNKNYNKGKISLKKLIVNYSSRDGVDEGNHERYDLLYYPDPGNTKIVRRYDPTAPGAVEPCWKGKNAGGGTE